MGLKVSALTSQLIVNECGSVPIETVLRDTTLVMKCHPFVFEIGSHVSQTGYELDMQMRMTVNS